MPIRQTKGLKKQSAFKVKQAATKTATTVTKNKARIDKKNIAPKKTVKQNVTKKEEYHSSEIYPAEDASTSSASASASSSSSSLQGRPQLHSPAVNDSKIKSSHTNKPNKSKTVDGSTNESSSFVQKSIVKSIESQNETKASPVRDAEPPGRRPQRSTKAMAVIATYREYSSSDEGNDRYDSEEDDNDEINSKKAAKLVKADGQVTKNKLGKVATHRRHRTKHHGIDSQQGNSTTKMALSSTDASAESAQSSLLRGHIPRESPGSCSGYIRGKEAVDDWRVLSAMDY
jgi:hypothetical protein